MSRISLSVIDVATISSYGASQGHYDKQENWEYSTTHVNIQFFRIWIEVFAFNEPDSGLEEAKYDQWRVGMQNLVECVVLYVLVLVTWPAFQS